MGKISASITIDGTPAPDLLASLLEMEVDQDHRLAWSFRVKVATHRGEDGLWEFLDDDRVALWKKVVISVNVNDDEQELISGFVTRVSVHLDPDEENSFVELSGMDATCLMALEEKIKDWPNRSDSDIARDIFKTYNLTPDVEDTGVIHDEAISTIIQRDTDIRFLHRLARRNGFEVRVNGGKGTFRTPKLSDKPRPPLAAHFGPDTNLSYFDAKVDALSPVRVEMHQIDPVAKQLQDATADAGKQKALGKNPALSFTPPNSATSRAVVKHAVATNQAEMDRLCRARFDEAEWFIEAGGVIDTQSYGAVLLAAQVVPVKGAGAAFSGLYHVTSVKHRFILSRYVQEFTARRNATGPKGDEFGDAASLF